MDQAVGRVIHYYDKLGVAIVEILEGVLKKGDQVKFSGHGHEFTQIITSMQKDHQDIVESTTGMQVGIKVDQKVKLGDQVFMVE